LKAEYFSSGIEGALIFVAAAAIVWTAIPRLFSPAARGSRHRPAIAVAAAANAACAWTCCAALRAARSRWKPTRHLLTDDMDHGAWSWA
jgi:divalent metal cation (Fe/Co/Zn/Cd) transporter